MRKLFFIILMFVFINVYGADLNYCLDGSSSGDGTLGSSSDMIDGSVVEEYGVSLDTYGNGADGYSGSSWYKDYYGEVELDEEVSSITIIEIPHSNIKATSASGGTPSCDWEVFLYYNAQWNSIDSGTSDGYGAFDPDITGSWEDVSKVKVEFTVYLDIDGAPGLGTVNYYLKEFRAWDSKSKARESSIVIY